MFLLGTEGKTENLETWDVYGPILGWSALCFLHLERKGKGKSLHTSHFPISWSWAWERG